VSAALDGDGGASFLLAGHRLRSRLSGGADGSGGSSGPDDGPAGRFHDPLKTFEIARLHADRTVDLLPGTNGASPAALADGERRLLVDVARTYVASDRHETGILGQAQRTTGAVLASVSGAAAEVGGGIRSLPARLQAAITRPRRLQPERRVVRFATILIALAIVSALYFQITARLSPLDAFSYAITLLTGAALPTSLDPAAVGVPLKVYAIVLSVVGAAIVAVVYALITDAIVRSRLLQTFGRRSVPTSISDHVIVAGLGSIGYRVALDLAARGVPVVVADIEEDGRFTAATRAAGIPVAVGDARHPEILADLGLDRARAVIAATSDDLVNIAIALNARAVRPEMRVVVRIFDPDFALRVQRGFRIRFTRSVSHLAAPAFAAAAIGSEVVATVPVGDRRVMLFARIPVTEGSGLAGAPIGALDRPGERSILAIDGPGDDDAEWTPGPDDAAQAGDELIVAATRAGLARLLERSRTRPPDADPVAGGAPA
jgi:Trk K+ transport system NAD-binding subunit